MTPRITIILHPNPTRIDLTVNDRLFNKEQYCFSRKEQARGDEATLLKTLNEDVIGITKAEASKNKLSLEISDGMLLKEFIPNVIDAVKRYGGKDYEPAIFCEDRRYEVSPVYSDDEWCKTLSPGVPMKPGTADLGIAYTVWVDK